jgi:hypothetical protein
MYLPIYLHYRVFINYPTLFFLLKKEPLKKFDILYTEITTEVLSINQSIQNRKEKCRRKPAIPFENKSSLRAGIALEPSAYKASVVGVLPFKITRLVKLLPMLEFRF